MLEGIIANYKKDVTGMSYPFSGITELSVVQEKVTSGLTPIVAFLGDKKFLVGDVSYMDFYFYECVQMTLHCLQPELFTQFPTLKTYCESVASLPGLKEYLAKPDRREATYFFNNKMAVHNGIEKA